MRYPARGVRFVTVAGVTVTLVDSVTWLDAEAHGQVVVTGSHGGTYSAIAGAERGPRALIFNDAGVGKNSAGILGLEALDRVGIAAATVGCWSARIGDAADTLADGVITHANAVASRCGVRVGITSSHAIKMLASAPQTTVAIPSRPDERVMRSDGNIRVYVLDSASLVDESMTDAIVVTASHGGVIGGGALRHDVQAAFFNDAGIGKDDAGIGRLAVLDRMGIPSVAVDCRSAMIGDGRDTFRNGVVSRVNATASRAGVSAGDAVADACAILAAAITRKRTVVSLSREVE